MVRGFSQYFWGISQINFKVFGPNRGTRNAKNPFGPFKVPNSNQKTAKLKKKIVIQMAPAGLRRSGKNSDVSKN